MTKEIEELKTLAAKLKNDMEGKAEAVGLITQVADLFDSCVQKPETFPADPKIWSYFYDEFAATVLQTITRLTVLQNPEVCLNLTE